MAAAGTPVASPMGLKMVAPVIMAFGNDAQKKCHLPPILSRRKSGGARGIPNRVRAPISRHCRCAAKSKGDHYLLNGSKIWTTHAQWADWMFNLVRTQAGREAAGQESASCLST